MAKANKTTKKSNESIACNDRPTLSLVFSAIAVAMGVAVVILSLTDSIDILSDMVMLGVAVFCLGVVCLMKSDCD